MTDEDTCTAVEFFSVVTKATTCPAFIEPVLPVASPYFTWNWFFIALILLYTLHLIRLCMGNTASSAVKKYREYTSGQENRGDHDKSRYAAVVVRKRRSSLQKDEDDDVAHEFYEEVRYKGGRSRMKKVFNTLPLGVVDLQIPCLHPDFQRIIVPNYDIANKVRGQMRRKNT